MYFCCKHFFSAFVFFNKEINKVLTLLLPVGTQVILTNLRNFSVIKPTKLIYALMLSLITILTFNVQAALKIETDHPLISRYQGATNFSNHVFDYAQTTLPVGIIDDRYQTKNSLVVEGRISYIHYRLPKATSQFEAIKVFQQQIKQSKFKVLFECQQNDVTNTNNCGKEMHYFARLEKVRGGFQFDCGNDEQFYLVSAKLIRANKKNSYLFICTEDGRVNQTIIDEKDFNANKIKINSKNYHPDEKALSGVGKQTEEEKEGAKDHPLISRYPNSVITNYSTIDYGKAELPLQGFAYNDIDKTRGAFKKPPLLDC